MTTDPTLQWWQADGGTAYVRRNGRTDADIAARTAALGRVLAHISLPPASVLEVGSGPGSNLVALLRLLPQAQIFAVEPSEAGRAASREVLAETHVYDGHACAIPAADGTFTMAMTAGVLIHVDPARLRDAMVEIARVSRRYVLAIEYFAPTREAVAYYGGDRIWRNDFGRLYVELGLTPIAHDFFWKAGGDGYDNCVAWLLEKPEGWTVPA